MSALAFAAAAAASSCLTVGWRTIRASFACAHRFWRWLRPMPGLPVDGDALDEACGGEAEQLAGLIYAYRNVTIPEPRYPAGIEMGDL